MELTAMEAIPECAAQDAEVPEVPEADMAEAKDDVEEEDGGDHSEQVPSYVLYIGNLNPKYPSEILCHMLKDIFDTAGVALERHNIEVVRKRRQAHAFVQMPTESNLEHVLKCLLLASDGEKDLTKDLVKKGKNMVVGPGKKPAFSNKDDRESDSVGSSSEPPTWDQQALQRRKRLLQKETQTHPVRKPAQHPCRAVDPAVRSLSGTCSDSAITQKEIVGKERLFYGAFLGSETRNVEFKRGGGDYLAVTLKHHVRKYTCAFLNSEGGSLFVGVEDSGLVRGVRCDHKDEDRIRLLVDSILKGFKPPVFPAAYSLNFIPVIKAEDTGIFLKVLRLSVHLPKQHGGPLLYETDQGEIYLRRDGSIQGPLTGSAIQEWCRQKWTDEIKKLDVKVQGLLEEKETLEQHIQTNARSGCCAVM